MAENSKIQWCNHTPSNIKQAAARCGVTPEEWQSRRLAGERRCFQCKKWFDEILFAVDRSRNGGRASRCKACVSIASTASRYGLTHDQVIGMRSSPCDICGRHGKMEIDHCHHGGQVRGILCSACNNAIGLFQDDVDVLQSAIDYLKKKGGISGRE